MTMTVSSSLSAALALCLPGMAAAHEPGEIYSLSEKALIIWPFCFAAFLLMSARDVSGYLLAGIMSLLAVALMFMPIIDARIDAARSTPVDPPHLETISEGAE